jgi:hypothetical protein
VNGLKKIFACFTCHVTLAAFVCAITLELSCITFHHNQTEFTQDCRNVNSTLTSAVEKERDTFGFAGQFPVAGNSDITLHVERGMPGKSTPLQGKLCVLKRPLFILNRTIRL